MSSPSVDMKDHPHSRLNGALWASHHPHKEGRMSMKIAIGAALLVELLLVVGLSSMKFHTEPPPAKKEMRVEIPPPPPPPEVKKIEPPAPPKKIDITPPKPKPIDKPPPAKPAPAPKEAVIPAAANPTADAPALATAPSNAPAGPATAAAGAPPAPAPLHGVVDGRGHCQAVQPQIPRKALQDGISASVIAHLTINPDGSVGDVKIMRVTPPTSVFNEAVITAGKAYKCEKNAEPYVGEVEFSFKTTAASDDDN
ncbi:MAG TPA: energy transducer TonB [Pararobbsia sp.]|nr:energy transducer TonB [Pararobbsia sp.]